MNRRNKMKKIKQHENRKERSRERKREKEREKINLSQVLPNTRLTYKTLYFLLITNILSIHFLKLNPIFLSLKSSNEKKTTVIKSAIQLLACFHIHTYVHTLYYIFVCFL